MAKEPTHKLASGDTAYLYRATIGPRGQDYYLRHFARFDGEGKAGSSWNWAAYWTTFNWLVYRRMWGWALAYVAALFGTALLIFGVGKLLFSYSDTSALLLFLLLLTVAFVVPGLYANAWFYTHCNEKISTVLRTSPEVRDAATVLSRQAPDNRRLMLLGLGNAVLLALVLAVYNGFQGVDSALPQLATHEERALAGGQSGQVRALAAAPAPATSEPQAPTTTPQPATVASAPAAAPAPAAAVALAAPEAPRAAQAASAPPTPSTARPATTGKPAMVNAADRSVAAVPARPEPAAPPAPAATAPVAAASPAPVAAPRPARAASAPQQRYVWVIQVGAYAQDANAQKALAQVQGLGLEAGAESFESPKGKLMRVRVGPFMRQAEADQAALRIKSLDLPVLVIRQRP